MIRNKQILEKIYELEDRISILESKNRFLNTALKGLAYCHGLEPVSLFHRRYDTHEFPHFEWKKING